LLRTGYLSATGGSNNISPRADAAKSSSSAKPAPKAGTVPPTTPSPTILASAQAVTAPAVPASPSSVTVNDHPTSPHPSTYSTPSTTPYKPNLEVQTSQLMSSIPEESSANGNGEQENNQNPDGAEEVIEEAAPASFGSLPSAKEDKFLFGSPLGLMTNMKNSSHTQSMPAISSSSDGSNTSPTGAGTKNSEYFRKLKEVGNTFDAFLEHLG
jgi:hypothetical protein